jgi:hypothetical protein
MKGIYLTQEGKQEIEAKIAELEVAQKEHEKVEINMFDYIWAAKTSQTIDLLKEILSLATILPVEESWESLGFDFATIPGTLQYSNGVIIQPKQ